MDSYHLQENKKSIPELDNKLGDLIRDSIPRNTLRAYKSDWSHFKNWCKKYDLKSLPANTSTVAYYLTDISDDYKISTIERRVATISKLHKLVDEDSPCNDEKVREVLKALRRTKSTNKRKVKPLLTPQIKRICKNLDDKLIDHRDRSLLLLGFTGGFRRSEISALNIEDVEKSDKGLIVNIKSSKTDQEGAGRQVGACYSSNPNLCPVRGYLRWVEKAGIREGAIFRSIDRHGNLKSSRLSSQSIALIIKKRVKQIDLDPSNYSGHSLRSGFVTQAFVNGASNVAVKNQTGHKTDRIVQEYYRPATLFQNNASALLNL